MSLYNSLMEMVLDESLFKRYRTIDRKKDYEKIKQTVSNTIKNIKGIKIVTPSKSELESYLSGKSNDIPIFNYDTHEFYKSFEFGPRDDDLRELDKAIKPINDEIKKMNIHAKIESDGDWDSGTYYFHIIGG